MTGLVAVTRPRAAWAQLARALRDADSVVWNEYVGDWHPPPELRYELDFLGAARRCLEPVAAGGGDAASLGLPASVWLDLVETATVAAANLEFRPDHIKVPAWAARDALVESLPPELRDAVPPVVRWCLYCQRAFPRAEFVVYSTGAISNRHAGCPWFAGP